MNAILLNNLAVLKTTQPDLARELTDISMPGDITVIPSKTGHPVMVRQGVSLHSRHDPEAESHQFARSDPVQKLLSRRQTPLVFGFGAGYHIRALLETFPRVLVFEPTIGLLKTALSLSDWRGFLPRIQFVTPGALQALGNEPIGLLIHRPSQRLDPEGCDLIQAALERKAVQKPKSGTPQKIMVVTPVCGGSLPIAFHAARALSALGYDVITADMTSLTPFYERVWRATAPERRQAAFQDQLMAFAGEYVTFLAQTEQPDLVLSLAQAPLNQQALEKIRALGVPSAFWFVEDYRLMGYFRHLAPYYDYFFHIQGRAMEAELDRLGHTDYLYLPLAADETLFRPINDSEVLAPYRAELSFMGAGYPNRRIFFNQLLDYDLRIWGSDWNLSSPLGGRVQDQGRRVTTEETVLIYNAARINLNLHSSIFSDGLDPEGNFINPRTFEVAACGAFQLVDRRHPLENHFDLDQEIMTFDSLSDLKEKIDHFTRHPEQCLEIAQNSRQRVLAEHTFRHRMRTMIDFIYHPNGEPE